MADEDIYGNKRRYLRFMKLLPELVEAVPARHRRGQRRYFCRNKDNLSYFRVLHAHFEGRDTSYVRRVRAMQVLLFLTSHTEKDLASCERCDIDELVAAGHKVNHTHASKTDFLKTVRFMWRVLFPARDEQGRPDERLTPYVVRHLCTVVDRSRKRLRNERLSDEEFLRLVGFFGGDPRMQAYMALAFESLARPQELAYRVLGDVELHEGYGRIWVSSHGKEGTKFLQCIDSYPYLVKWLEQHPLGSDPQAPLFPSKVDPRKPLRPESVNVNLKRACRFLGMDKRITGYSLKRNGVTSRRLRGDSDVEIQHVAGWTSTKQLQIYDLSSAEDTFERQLRKRGVLGKEQTKKADLGSIRNCSCGQQLGFADRFCRSCKREVKGLVKSSAPRGVSSAQGCSRNPRR